MHREFIRHYIEAREYYEEFGLEIPYGRDIIIFFPEGSFEYRIGDARGAVICKQVHNSDQNIVQVNISFLQYVKITLDPELYIRSLGRPVESQVMVVFTLL